jgi:uncharacterized protein YkwD
MKKLMLMIMILVNFTCSTPQDRIPTLHTYQYSLTEIDLLDRINTYRDSIGLNTLQKNEHIAYICQEHNIYMIETGTINHSNFQYRVENLQLTLDAERIGENIAYNYQTPISTLNAWLNSPGHKKNIEGDYTDFGLSTTQGPTYRNYVTLILIKK